MFNIKKQDDKYTLSTQRNSVELDSVEDLIKLMLGCKVDGDEITIGLMELNSGKTYLEYGINKTFVFSR